MMKHLILVILLCLPTIVVAQDCPTGLVRIYVHRDNDKQPDAMGSGTLISPTQILTNWHVVESRRDDPRHRSMSLEVRLHDGTRRYAAVVGQDKIWDLALLQVHPIENIDPFTLGEAPKVDDIVTIHGFGFDYEYKAGVGKVSEKMYYPKNADPSDRGSVLEILGYAARQGDSGGPVTDHLGHLVAIVNASCPEQHSSTSITIERARKLFGTKLKPSREIGGNDGSIYLFQGSK